MRINTLEAEKTRCKIEIDAHAVTIRQQRPADYSEKVRQAKAFLVDPSTPQPFIDLDAEVFAILPTDAARQILNKNSDVEFERMRLEAKRSIEAVSLAKDARQIVKTFKQSAYALLHEGDA